MTDQPVCIRRVNTLEEAQLLVAWLDDYEIDATVVGAQNPGSLAFGISDFEGIGVFVTGGSAAERAGELLAEHDARSPASEPDDEYFDVTCDECGEVTTFQRGEVGTVQTCAACGAFVDVPDDAMSV
ncbi:MAG: hypothetical protein IH989_00305 [Planctomycetes bacterium]|nr:hypothetical protein [Planctomycetota bacterium]